MMTTYHTLPLIPRAVSLLAYLETVQDPGMHVEVMYLHGEPLGRANHFTQEDMRTLIQAGVQKLEEEPPRKMGPLKADHPLVTDHTACLACHEEFAEGDYVSLLPLGPGNDPENRRKAREGRPYTAAAIPLHWACMTGQEE